MFSLIRSLIGIVRISPNRVLILGTRSDAWNASIRMMGTAAFARMRPHGASGTAADGGMHLSRSKGDNITANLRK